MSSATACTECPRPASGGSTFCEPHLRGLALVALDRHRWPRLRAGGRTIAGDDAWRPWLRAADGDDLRRLHALLVKEALR